MLLTLAAGVLASSSPAQEVQPTDRQVQHLLGPVKSVHTVATFQPSPDSPARTLTVSDATYTPDGWLLEARTCDAEGNPLSRHSNRRDGERLLEEDITYYSGPEVGRRVTTFDEQGRVRQIASYTLDGLLRDRLVLQPTAGGWRKTIYGPSGEITSDVALHKVYTPQPDGLRSQTIADGEVIRESKSKPTPDGMVVESSHSTPEGHRSSTAVYDRNGTRRVQIGPKGEAYAAATDLRGQTATSISLTPDGRETRRVQHFDDKQRLTAIDSYEGGALHHKQIITYQDDEHGNWVKQVDRQFRADGQPQSISTTLRTLDYY
jgi:hypothetical protein